MKGSDQISKLPEPILQHILSFLVVKDAARTSILSKAWNNAWTSLSYLNFGDKIFRESKDIMDQILATRQKQNISIQNFMLKLPNNRSKDIDDWTKLLVACGFKLELPSNGIKFSSLRDLHLEDSYLDEQFLQVLRASCNCPFDFERIDIAIPNLINLYISSLSRELNVINITACETLQYLNLSDVAVTDQWLQKLLPHLPKLDVFYASLCPLLKTVKISSHRLKYLQIVLCHNLIEVDLDTPNLLGFQSDVRYDAKGFSFIGNYLPTFKTLIKFNHSRAITLSCKSDKWIVIPKDMRNKLISPLYGTKLSVNINNGLNYPVVEVLENLLWISPQLDTLSFGRALNIKTLKFTYRDASDGEDERRRCCASLSWKCWRHELKKVELQNFTFT
ncbi:hypothetical protein HAX54_026192 [Datura stramonium]|uniref:F-box domain-containing protein n=1 Tax=Datura stramonium TaxID=4076 RepID=A0ABS8V2D6_DATST|nr:hypothetical protein [Datura stramonium]